MSLLMPSYPKSSVTALISGTRLTRRNSSRSSRKGHQLWGLHFSDHLWPPNYEVGILKLYGGGGIIHQITLENYACAFSGEFIWQSNMTDFRTTYISTNGHYVTLKHIFSRTADSRHRHRLCHSQWRWARRSLYWRGRHCCCRCGAVTLGDRGQADHQRAEHGDRRRGGQVQRQPPEPWRRLQASPGEIYSYIRKLILVMLK